MPVSLFEPSWLLLTWRNFSYRLEKISACSNCRVEKKKQRTPDGGMTEGAAAGLEVVAPGGTGRVGCSSDADCHQRDSSRLDEAEMKSAKVQSVYCSFYYTFV